MGIKIKMVNIDGEDRVPPEVMDLLTRFSQHREFCEDCQRASQLGHYERHCSVGVSILNELYQQPEVEYTPD